jgi:hypothetical protein
MRGTQVESTSVGPIALAYISCDHRGKPSKKRMVCHFEDGMVRHG